MPIREAEQALRESEERLKLALAAAQMGVSEYDFASGRVIFSESFARLLGYQPDAVTETFDWFLSHVHTDDRALVSRTRSSPPPAAAPFRSSRIASCAATACCAGGRRARRSSPARTIGPAASLP
jgi:PAS domain-containing protein